MAETVEPSQRLEFGLATAGFLAWFNSADCTRLSPKVQLQDLRSDHAGRGVVALSDIEDDEELFAIPRSLVLTTTTSSIPPAILEPLKEMGAWPPLIVTIIYEYIRGGESPWHSYFQVLPTTFDSLMFWNEAELETLQASAVTGKIGRYDAEETWKKTIIPIMLEYPEIFPAGDGTMATTAELMKFAHMAGSLIMAYAFDIDRDNEGQDNLNDEDDEFEEDDEDEPLKGMVPFADMLNADADRNNARLFQETDYLIMKATKPIKAGEQIFNDYGPLPRSDLLRMYGYITDNYAQYDVVEISHDLLLEVAGKKHAKKDETWQKQEEQLEEIGVIDDGYAIPRPATELDTLHDAIPGQVHMLLRALCAEANPKRKDAVTISEAALLQSVLTKRLSEYGSSLAADRAVLRSLDNSDSEPTIPSECSRTRYAMALQVRIGEKEILHRLVELCQNHIATKTTEMASGLGKRPHEDDSSHKPNKSARQNKSRH